VASINLASRSFAIQTAGFQGLAGIVVRENVPAPLRRALQSRAIDQVTHRAIHPSIRWKAGMNSALTKAFDPNRPGLQAPDTEVTESIRRRLL